MDPNSACIKVLLSSWSGAVENKQPNYFYCMLFFIFAFLGVFIPLFYDVWNAEISRVLTMPTENNVFVIILFTVGLTLNFGNVG